MRGFHLKDYKRLIAEARQLSQETSNIRNDVESDETAEWNIKIATMETITTAVEWDTGISIALAAWDDIMQPNEGLAGDLESQMEDKRVRKRRKSHGQYIISLMRKQVIEGIDRRKELSIQLQRMHVEVMARHLDSIDG
ncbi:hypothetical protein LSUE1_G002850 [Lachnellula suecica]|uniref:Uncharacterized protein n=1 Tax=Lachnellula suecica TaxID=602035 RepID=A0A8T9CCF0_9HELO|nr:hypothetical protein LSUE1_G002850 [Lachnellula suecica]